MTNLKLISSKHSPDKNELVKILMMKYSRKLFDLAFTYVKDKHVAEDIVQDVFIKCYKKLDTFRGDASYQTWLYRITINSCKDYLKSWSFKHIKLGVTIKNFTKNNASAEHTFMTINNNKLLADTVMALPLKYREVIILYYYEEMTYQEIATLINSNKFTVRSRIERGKEILKKNLNTYELGDLFEKE